MIIPPTGRWQSTQNGDAFGSLIRSKNLSLDREGAAALARKAMVIYSHDDDAGFGTPIAMDTDGTYAYVLTADGHTFVIDLTAAFFSIVEASDTDAPTIGTDSDLVIFNDKPHASGGAKVNYLNAFGQGQTWHGTAPITDLSTSYPHPMCPRPRANTLLVADGNVLRQYSTGYSRDTANELTIPSAYIITCVRTVGSDIFIGTRHRYGGEARFFVWNGAGTATQREYGCGANWIYAMEPYQSSAAIVTSAGQLKWFNNGGFNVLASLPVYHTPYSWASAAAETSLVGKVASRGMRVAGDRLLINLDGSINNPSAVSPGQYLPDQPSGLWVFDPSAGLYHKAGYNHQSKLRLTISGLNSSYVGFATAHQAELGDAVLYTGSLTGPTSGQVYYAIPDSTTTLRLALTPQDAVAGRYVSITGSLSGNDRCTFDRYESAGHTAISGPGGLLAFGQNGIYPFYGSEVMFGGAALDETLAAKGVLMSLGMGRNVGSFVTPRISSNAIASSWQRIAAHFAPHALATDSTVVKYRTRRQAEKRSIRLTWTAANAFTVDTALYDFTSVQVGDEIEVIAGAGAGFTAHITAIDASTTAYAVTIDESLAVEAGDLSIAFADNWTKLATFSTDSDDNASGYGDTAIGANDAWIQFKVEMRGVKRDLSMIQLASKELKKLA